MKNEIARRMIELGGSSGVILALSGSFAGFERLELLGMFLVAITPLATLLVIGIERARQGDRYSLLLALTIVIFAMLAFSLSRTKIVG